MREDIIRHEYKVEHAFMRGEQMTVRTRIKVCGLTDLGGVQSAVAAGVDALGFIFADKSPRKIEPEKAKKLIASLPPFVDAVGVFVNEEPRVVDEIAQYCHLTMVQLHGNESVEYCESLQRRILKAFRVKPGMDADKLTKYANVAEGFLVDTYNENMEGGTGEAFDWSLLEKMDIPGPLILAGGLDAANVSQAIRQVRPFAVDVNSGVEKEPGVKDIDKIIEFVRKVAMADSEIYKEIQEMELP